MSIHCSHCLLCAPDLALEPLDLLPDSIPGCRDLKSIPESLLSRSGGTRRKPSQRCQTPSIIQSQTLPLSRLCSTTTSPHLLCMNQGSFSKSCRGCRAQPSGTIYDHLIHSLTQHLPLMSRWSPDTTLAKAIDRLFCHLRLESTTLIYDPVQSIVDSRRLHRLSLRPHRRIYRNAVLLRHCSRSLALI